MMTIASKKFAMLSETHFLVHRATHVKLVIHQVHNLIDHLSHALLHRYKATEANVPQVPNVLQTGTKKPSEEGFQTP
jgi:hypothetical protein